MDEVVRAFDREGEMMRGTDHVLVGQRILENGTVWTYYPTSQAICGSSRRSMQSKRGKSWLDGVRCRDYCAWCPLPAARCQSCE